jgi:hypothetical protein
MSSLCLPCSRCTRLFLLCILVQAHIVSRSAIRPARKALFFVFIMAHCDMCRGTFEIIATCRSGLTFCLPCWRYVNIDMISVIRSTGGVGSSVYSAGLHARLGRQNHQYFDARILTDGEKLSVVIPTMMGKCAYTTQEQPGGSDRFQGDLFKKVATAEGLLDRLPHTIIAKLFKLKV